MENLFNLFREKNRERKNNGAILSERSFEEETIRFGSLEALDRRVKDFAQHALQLDLYPRRDCHPNELSSGIVNFLSTRENPVFFDVGGGHGNVSRGLIEQKIPRLQVSYLDIYPPKDLRDNRIRVIKTDLNKTRFQEYGEADLSAAIKVSRYLKDPLDFINRMISATKRGGYVIVDGINRMELEYTTPDGYNFTHMMFSFNAAPYLEYDSSKIQIFSNPLFYEDLVATRVLDPIGRIEAELQRDKSTTIGTIKTRLPHIPIENIGESAYFVYRKR